MAEFEFYRSVGGGQNLGGAISGTRITGGLNAVFDDVSEAEATSGRIEYRCIYILNPGQSQRSNIRVYLSEKTANPDTRIDIGVSNHQLETPNETTEPGTNAIAWSHPTSKNNSLLMGGLEQGQARQIWLRRTVQPGAASSLDQVSLVALRWSVPPKSVALPVPLPQPPPPKRPVPAEPGTLTTSWKVAGPADVISPTKFSNVPSFGAHALSYELSATAFANAQSFGTHNIADQTTLTATKFTNNQTFGAPSMSAALSASSFANAQNFGTPTLSATIAATSFANAQSFGSHEVAEAVSLTLQGSQVVVNSTTDGLSGAQTATVNVPSGCDLVIFFTFPGNNDSDEDWVLEDLQGENIETTVNGDFSDYDAVLSIVRPGPYIHKCVNPTSGARTLNYDLGATDTNGFCRAIVAVFFTGASGSLADNIDGVCPTSDGTTFSRSISATNSGGILVAGGAWQGADHDEIGLDNSFVTAEHGTTGPSTSLDLSWVVGTLSGYSVGSVSWGMTGQGDSDGYGAAVIEVLPA